MPTGQVIVTNALTILGINEQGGTPSPSDSVDALNELNSMWDAWSVDEGLIYALLQAQYALTANKGAYSIGTGLDFSAPRPSRIYKASIVAAVSFAAGTTSTSATITVANTTGLAVGQQVQGTGIPYGSFILTVTTNTSIVISQAATATGSPTLLATGSNRNELDIINADKYFNHNDLGASSNTPDELYPDYNATPMFLYLYPVPKVTTAQVLELISAVTFAAWTLGGNYPLAPAYQDCIQYALAMRLIPRFGQIVPQEIAQVVMAVGGKAEQRIRAMNAFDRMQPPPTMAVPDTAPQKVA